MNAIIGPIPVGTVSADQATLSPNRDLPRLRQLVKILCPPVPREGMLGLASNTLYDNGILVSWFVIDDMPLSGRGAELCEELEALGYRKGNMSGDTIIASAGPAYVALPDSVRPAFLGVLLIWTPHLSTVEAT